MSLRHPGGLNNPGDARRRLVDASWGEVITHPTVIILSSIMVFAVTFAVLSWRDGTFSHLFVAKGATIDSSSRSWMGSANASRYRPDTPQVSGPDAAALKQAKSGAQQAARAAQAAAEASAGVEEGTSDSAQP